MRNQPSSALVRNAKEACRVLRKSQTSAEAALWERLRNRQLCGSKFLRQHPLFINDAGRESFVVADFFCFEHSLAIEVDGPIHEGRVEYDDNRSEVLARRRIRVMRFNNTDIERDLDGVVAQIEGALEIALQIRTDGKGSPSLSKRGG